MDKEDFPFVQPFNCEAIKGPAIMVVAIPMAVVVMIVFFRPVRSQRNAQNGVDIVDVKSPDQS